jgi:hypothetical protein
MRSRIQGRGAAGLPSGFANSRFAPPRIAPQRFAERKSFCGIGMSYALYPPHFNGITLYVLDHAGFLLLGAVSPLGRRY